MSTSGSRQTRVPEKSTQRAGEMQANTGFRGEIPWGTSTELDHVCSAAQTQNGGRKVPKNVSQWIRRD